MVFDIDTAQLVSFLIGTILPLLVGLVTRWNTSAAVRAVLLLLLSAVTSVLTELLAALNAGTVFDLGAVLLAALTTFLIGVGVHFGLWNPTGAAKAMQRSGGFIGGSSGTAGPTGGTVIP